MQALRSYFQLIAILFLCTETFWMALSLIYGIIAGIVKFLWALVLLTFGLLSNNGFILIAVWGVLLKMMSSRQILSLLQRTYSKAVVGKVFKCQICSEYNCELVFSQCSHAFHSSCLPYGKEYLEQQICPKCCEKKRGTGSVHVLNKMAAGFRLQNVGLLSYVIVGSIIYGVIAYFQDYLSLFLGSTTEMEL